MFKDFKYQKSNDYVLMRLLEIQDYEIIELIKNKIANTSKYKSSVIMPEQLVGYEGLIYTVSATRLANNYLDIKISKCNFSYIGNVEDRKKYKYLTDEDIVMTRGIKVNTTITQFNFFEHYFFLNKKDAINFSQVLMNRYIS